MGTFCVYPFGHHKETEPRNKSIHPKPHIQLIHLPDEVSPVSHDARAAMFPEESGLSKRTFVNELRRHGIIQRGIFMFEDGVRLNYKVDFGRRCAWPHCSRLGAELGSLVSALLPRFEIRLDYRNIAVIVATTRIHKDSILSQIWICTPPGVNFFPLDELEKDSDIIQSHDKVILFVDDLETGTNLLDSLDKELDRFTNRISRIIIGFDHGIGGRRRIQAAFPGVEIVDLLVTRDLDSDPD